MIIVKLIIKSGLKKIITKDFIKVDLKNDSNFLDLAEELIKEYGEELRHFLYSDKYGFICFCIKNKRKVLPSELLEDGDEVVFLSPLAGG